MSPSTLGALICAAIFLVPMAIIATTTWPVDWPAVGQWLGIVVLVALITRRRS